MATQPGTGLAIFGQQGALPAHISNFFDEEGTNIQARTTVPSLSPEGKTWTIAVDGQKNKMQRRNGDGDLEPLPIMKGIFLDYSKERGRAYYEGEYDPNKVSAPVCWSDDGVAPDNSLPGPYSAQQMAELKIEKGASRKISEKCASCPMSVKGSKVRPDGKAVTACAQHRMLAVLPDPAMGLPAALQKPLRLKIAMTSDWDKESPQEEMQGWLSWSRYVEWLNTRGCKHTAAIVTKMKFDTNAAFPKIFFASERALTPDELTMVKPLLHSDDVKKLLGGTWTPAGVDGIPKDQQQVAAPQAVGEPETTDQPPVVAAAAPPPVAAPSAVEPGIPAGYVMSPAEAHTYQAYRDGGWTDDQLISNGKLIAATPPPAQSEVVAAPAPAPAPAAAPASEVVVVGEPAAAAAGTAATAAAASQPAAEAVVIVETPVAQPAAATEPSPGLAAPAAVVVQEPAQASAPAPVSTPQAPEPPAAAAAAAEATPAVSTDVPADVEALMSEWG